VLKQLLNTFPRGTVFHACRSSLDGPMDWTYGQKPRLSAACATGPDGRLRFAAVNATGIVGDTESRYYPAQALRLELDLPWQKRAFDGFVIGPDGRTRAIGGVAAGVGKTGPTLQPFEIAVLIERSS